MTTPRVSGAKHAPPSELRITGRRNHERILFGRGDRLIMDGVDLVRVDLSRQRGASFHVLGGSRFVECDFSGSSFRHSVVLGTQEQSLYQSCAFDRAVLHGCGSNVRLVGCTFVDAYLTDWFGTALELIDCKFDGCRIERSKFWGRPHGIPPNVPDRTYNEFVGNDFSRADLRNVSFAGGIDLTRQRLPSGPNYRVVRHLSAAVDRARAGVALWTDDAARTQGLRKLRVLSEISLQGQDQALVDLRAWDSMPRATVDAILKLLEAAPTG